jgi:hypothetical protein
MPVEGPEEHSTHECADDADDDVAEQPCTTADDDRGQKARDGSAWGDRRSMPFY